MVFLSLIRYKTRLAELEKQNKIEINHKNIEKLTKENLMKMVHNIACENPFQHPDNAIKWLVTHKISPDIDTERELLFTDLHNAGHIATASKESFVPPTLGENFSGDAFFTDGKIYLVILK